MMVQVGFLSLGLTNRHCAASADAKQHPAAMTG